MENPAPQNESDKKPAPPAETENKPAPSAPQTSNAAPPMLDSNSAVAILLLFLIYPVGLLFMWFGVKNWPVWLKIVLTLPLILSLLFFLLGMTILIPLLSSFTEGVKSELNMPLSPTVPVPSY